VNPADAEKVLQTKDHMIDNKLVSASGFQQCYNKLYQVDAKHAVRGEKYKVFVGGIPTEAKEEDLKKALGRFGEICTVSSYMPS